MKEKTLLIMAAGMGSRFGGLKQIEPVGPSGEFIIDYSIYDAKKAGFTKVVFVVKEENYEIFKETIGKRVEPYIKTEYVFQDNNGIPEKYIKEIKKRQKPLGTAHAILCAKEKIKEPFAVINADDFYGYDAYQKASKYLDNVPKNHYAMVGYHVVNTLSPNGAAKRGICKLNNHHLEEVTESSVEIVGTEIIAPIHNRHPCFYTVLTYHRNSLCNGTCLIWNLKNTSTAGQQCVDKFWKFPKNMGTKYQIYMSKRLFHFLCNMALLRHTATQADNLLWMTPFHMHQCTQIP